MTSKEIILIDPATDREHVFKCHYHVEDEEIILDEVTLVVLKLIAQPRATNGNFPIELKIAESDNILDIVISFDSDTEKWAGLYNQLCNKIYEDLIVQKKEVLR